MTSCRGEVGLNTYPQGPAGEPESNGERDFCSTGGWDIYQGGKYNAWSAATTRGLKIWKMSPLFWPDDEEIYSRGQTDGMGGLGWKGTKRGEEAINISRWKKGDITLSLERRKGTFFVFTVPLFKELLSKKAPVSAVPKWREGLAECGSSRIVIKGSLYCFKAQMACLNLTPIIRLESPEKTLWSS